MHVASGARAARVTKSPLRVCKTAAMLVLLTFAVLAGAGTALSPCVLPVLPALLSAGGVGGRRRPLGIVLGLSVTFTVTIVGVASVVDGVGLGSDPLRDVAIVGAARVRPDAADAERRRPPRGAAVAPRALRAEQHRRRLPLGAARRRRARLRLHAVREPDPRGGDLGQRRVGKTVAIALAYAAGSAVVLLALALGGRRVFDRVRKAGRGPQLQRALGVIMILTALAIMTNLDVNFDQFVAQHIPDVNLTASLECSKTVTEPPAPRSPGTERSSRPPTAPPRAAARRRSPRRAAPTPARRRCSPTRTRCPDLGTAPEFTETQDWFNTPGACDPADARVAARTRRAGRLLDLHVHQLHPHAALPEGVGRRLPPGRPDDRRRRDARVRVRARRQQRRRTRSSSSACATRSSRTTTWARGTRTATSTGPPTT